MFSGIFLLALAIFFWFGVAKDATEDSKRGFVKIWKSIFGLKGYIITAKVLSIFLALAACAEFYKYFTESN